MKLVKIEKAASRLGLSCGQVIELLTKNIITDGEIIDQEIYIPNSSIEYLSHHRDLLFNLRELFGTEAASIALNMSLCSVFNWIRLKKLVPDRIYQGKPFFYRDTLLNLRKSMQDEPGGRLRSRRNKSCVEGNEYYASYLHPGSPNRDSVDAQLRLFGETGDRREDPALISLILAECALQLLNQRLGIWMCSGTEILRSCLLNRIDLLTLAPLVEPLIMNRQAALETVNSLPRLFSVGYYYEKNEDLLGCLYLSLSSMSARRAGGVYYTPRRVVSRLTETLGDGDMLGDGISYYDPCCGTGNFLISLPGIVSWDHLSGSDIDRLAVILCRINLFLRDPETPPRELQRRFTVADYLADARSGIGFSLIHPGEPLCVIGNPPWGIRMTPAEKLALNRIFHCAIQNNCESFALFLEKSIRNARTGDFISFVLPESLLNVAAHLEIRKIIAACCSVRSCVRLGNQFDGVSCPSIILTLRREEDAGNRDPKILRCRGALIHIPGVPPREFVIDSDRIFQGELDLLLDNQEYALLRRIMSCPDTVSLKDGADWALGIVTGDNKGKLKPERTRKTEEPVLRGLNIDRYRINMKNVSYIEFRREELQQAAKEEYYRADEKLLYRFINRDLIFAWDSRRMLPLNSANVVIPRIPGMSVRYVLMLLNSRVARFVFQKKFASAKVLRSHLEAIPLIKAPPELMGEIEDMASQLLDRKISSREEDEIRNSADRKLAALYGLSEDETALLFRELD